MELNWHDLLNALALLLILEGLMPFLSPARLKQAYAQLLELPDKTLRTIGLVSVIAGILLLFVTD
ncbi:MAG TPA: DUF2065 domain-containing protein [Candidatus Thiothrix moscowensis]|uniref:DUF2065 domain-containing protein n=1 Tax=unclassified Thiothrix TaxID=2636184 RepID=UPI0025E62AA9|nr:MULTISPECIES: DUF2065 domain-containing protein [unclassified Thiothrix]HRJ53591.1 DUF2065 domain-containing protein [Candidatus Thiothrix moscowensis]HRJ93601.1 DUF2065 domain-containing protein [Candidatus Thiothrix moscowensis]